MYEVHFQHSKVRLDFDKFQYKSPNLFPLQAYKGLIKVAKSMKLNYKPLQIQSYMWDFEGGLKLSPTTGNVLH